MLRTGLDLLELLAQRLRLLRGLRAELLHRLTTTLRTNEYVECMCV